MSLSVMAGISLKQSAENELESMKKSLASGFILSVDMQNELYRGEVDYGNGLSSYGYAGPKIAEEMLS